MRCKTKSSRAERIRLLKEVIRLFAKAQPIEQEREPLVLITTPLLNCPMGKFKRIYKQLLKLQAELSQHD